MAQGWVPWVFFLPFRLGLEKPATQQHQRARTKRPKKNLLFGWKLKKVTAHQTEHSQKKLRPPPHLCRQRPVGDSRLFPTTSCMEVTRCRWCQRRPGRGWESHLRCMVAGSTYPSSCGGGFRGDWVENQAFHHQPAVMGPHVVPSRGPPVQQGRRE